MNVSLTPKLTHLDSYRATNFGGKGDQELISFWRKIDDIEESIKFYYKGGNAFMLIAQYEGYTKSEATKKLDDLILKIGKDNLTAKEGDPRPFYYVNCDKEFSAQIFINRVGKNESAFYIVNITITNNAIYRQITRDNK